MPTNEEQQTLEIDELPDFWGELNKDPQFAGLSYTDKIAYGTWWAGQQGLDPVTSQALAVDVQKSIAGGFKTQLAAELPEPATFTGELTEDIQRGLVRPVEQIATSTAAFADRARVQPLSKTATEVGWGLTDATVHVAGLAPRLGISLAEVPTALVGVAAKATGGNFLALWMETAINELEAKKQNFIALQHPLNQVEEGVMLASVVGAGTGAALRALGPVAGRLTGSTALAQITPMTAREVAIVARSAAIGEAAVVTPTMSVINESLNTSTFDKETRDTLRIVMPVVVGVLSGATLEARIERFLGNKQLVNQVVAQVKAGATPTEVASSVERLVKAPTLSDEVGAVANGSAVAERTIPAPSPPPRVEPELLPDDAFREVERVLEPEAIQMIGRRGEVVPLKPTEQPGFETRALSGEEQLIEESWTRTIEGPKPPPTVEPPVTVTPRAPGEEPAVIPTAEARAIENAWTRQLGLESEVTRETAALRAAQLEHEQRLVRRTARLNRAEQRLALKQSPPPELTEVASLDNVIADAMPATQMAARTTVRPNSVGNAIDFGEFVERHGVVLEKLSKYFEPEFLQTAARMPQDASELTTLHIDNLLGLAYKIPVGRTWTVEAFDDMIEVAQHAEALHVRIADLRQPHLTTKSQLLDELDGWLGEAVGKDAQFVKRVVQFIKKEDGLFRLLPVREVANQPSAQGVYQFSSNLLRLRDARAFPHEVGHWGFMNALTGPERLQYLTMLRDRVASGWTPGENLARTRSAAFPDGSGRLRGNIESDPNEYFAEQFAQYFYTRRTDGRTLHGLLEKVGGWARRLYSGLKNEKLLDAELEPFFKRFAEVEKLERLHHPEMGELLGPAEALSEAFVAARAVGQRLGGDTNLLAGPGFTAVKRELVTQVRQLLKDGRLTLDDARRLQKLSDKNLRELLFDPRPSTMLRTMRDLGMTAQTDPSLVNMALRTLHDESGSASADFLRSTAIHALPLMTGLETRDGELTFNVGKFMKFGGAFYGILYGGKAWRRLGGPGKVFSLRSSATKRFFDFMTEPAEGGLSKVRQLAGDFLTGFRPTEGLDPDIWGLGRQFKTRWFRIDEQLQKFSEHLAKNYTLEEREMISNIIEQEGDDWLRASEALTAQAREVQSLTANVREMLVKSGVDPKLLEKYGDQWLHRVYMPKVTDNPRAFVRRKMRSLHQTYLQSRGQQVRVKNPELKFGLDRDGFAPAERGYSWLDKLGRKRWALESQTDRVVALDAKYGRDSRIEWTVEKTPRGVTARRDWTKAERQAMGESLDVSVRMADFFHEAAHDAALGEMFGKIDSRHAVTAPEGLKGHELQTWASENGLVKMPNTYSSKGIARYGALNGKYVPADVKRVLERLTGTRYESELRAAVAGAWKKLHSAWKTGVTAYNPGSHVTNFVTNDFLLVADGRNPAKVLYLGAEALHRETTHFREAIDAGFVPHSLGATEFDLQTFAKVTTESPEAGFPKVLDGFMRALRFVKDAPKKAYSGADDVVKLGIFVEERLKGRSPQEALRAAEKIIPDYTDLPRNVEFLRDSALLPFVSWSYKVLPTIGRTLVERPEVYLGTLVALKALNDYGYERQFGEKAEAQRALEDELHTKEKRDSQMFGFGPSGRIRLQNDGQTARYLDVRKYIPGSDLFESTFSSFPFGTSPVITTLYGFVSGKMQFGDRKIFPFDDPQTDAEREKNFDAGLQFLANTWLPKIPGMPLAWNTDKLGNALVAHGTINNESGWLWDVAQRRGWTGKEFFGADADLTDALLQTAGIPISRLDVPGTYQFRQAQLTKRITDAPKILTRAALEAKSTPARMEQAREQYLQQVTTASEEQRRLAKLLEETR